jgi:hypothetical protein
VNAELIEQLLYESESATLDFKRDQYPFDGASDETKGELLKDILAFANSWRRSDAYILIGVDDVVGGRGVVVGVTEHLDDAKLQQFVTTKTQRPLHFSYRAVPFEGKELGIIQIPLQERPLYLMKDFGKLNRSEVFIRRGSSTGIAAPDEIAKMGVMPVDGHVRVPELDLAFYDCETLGELGENITLHTHCYDLSKLGKIPDYIGPMTDSFHEMVSYSLHSIDLNRDYWRELAAYLQTRLKYGRLDFLVKNSGRTVAQDVRLQCELEVAHSDLLVADASMMAERPSAKRLISLTSVSNTITNPDISVRRGAGKWLIDASIGKIQPQGHAHTESGLYITGNALLRVKISADNLPSPVSKELIVSVVSTWEKLDQNSLMKLLKRFDMGASHERD